MICNSIASIARSNEIAVDTVDVINLTARRWRWRSRVFSR